MEHSSLKVNYETITEEELLNLLRKKDKGAFEYLYDLYSCPLFNIILRIVKTGATAEKILESCFIKIWKNIIEYDPKKEKLFTWIVKLCKLYSKQEMKYTPYIEALMCNSQSLQHHFVSVEDDLENFPEHNHQELDDKILNLMYFQCYSEQEICNIYNISQKSVRERIRSALQNDHAHPINSDFK